MAEAAKADTADDVKIRPLVWRDLDAIVEIDNEVTGRSRDVFWQNKIMSYSGLDPGACLVAELNGDVVGFMFGERKYFEYGAPQSGWIEIIGVKPELQHKGIGKVLAEALLGHFRRSHIGAVQTLVNPDDKNIMSFFESLGFEKAKLVNMQRKV